MPRVGVSGWQFPPAFRPGLAFSHERHGTIGTASQAKKLGLPAEAGGDLVRNMGGQTDWADIPQLLRQADLVISNNSGIAHLATATGVRTLAIHSASHEPQE